MTRPHLTEAQRAVLLDLIAGDPLGTCERIARNFEAVTGRRVSLITVQRAWVRGYKPVERDEPDRNLSEAERLILFDLCREAPEASHGEIARRFALAAGRSIQPGSVGKFRRRHLGDRRSPGRPRKATV